MTALDFVRMMSFKDLAGHMSANGWWYSADKDCYYHKEIKEVITERNAGIAFDELISVLYKNIYHPADLCWLTMFDNLIIKLINKRD